MALGISLITGTTIKHSCEGYPDDLSWSGPGAGSMFDYFKTLMNNLLYQTVIKPYFFVQPQLEQFRKAFRSYIQFDKENW